jgi:DNA-binding GntR family transcriptional regulator
MHRAVLDAVVAQQPLMAEKAILNLIDGARDDIHMILGSRKRLPKIARPASQLKAA